MADNEYGYLSSSAPDSQGMARTIKLDWSGLNLTNTIESGELSDCNNISTDEAPYLVPSGKTEVVEVNRYNQSSSTNPNENKVTKPLAFISTDDGNNMYILFLEDKTYRLGVVGKLTGDGYKLYENRITSADFAINIDNITEDDYRQLLKMAYTPKPFLCYYNTANSSDNITSDIVNSSTSYRYYIPLITKIIKSKYDNDGITASYKETDSGLYMIREGSFSKVIINSEKADSSATFPRYIAVHSSRLFAAGETIVGASAYMGAGDWVTDLDYMTATQDGYGANHAWISSIQSDDHGYSGDVTGIASYGGRVIVFKKNNMYEIVNNKNPFRVTDVFEVGCSDNRSVQVVNGNLFFASENSVNIYTGGKPVTISDKLYIKKFDVTVAGTDGRRYYLYAKGVYRDGEEFNNLFVYDTEVGSWTKRSFPDGKEAVAMQYFNGSVYALSIDKNYHASFVVINTEDYKEQKWFAETDISLTDTNGNYTVMPKRINKLRFLAELDAGSSLEVSVIGADEDYKEDILCKKTYTNDSEKMKRIPIRLNIRKKADYGFKVRVSGVGYAKVYSMEISYTDGGAMDVTDREGISKA